MLYHAAAFMVCTACHVLDSHVNLQAFCTGYMLQHGGHGGTDHGDHGNTLSRPLHVVCQSYCLAPTSEFVIGSILRASTTTRHAQQPLSGLACDGVRLCGARAQPARAVAGASQARRSDCGVASGLMWVPQRLRRSAGKRHGPPAPEDMAP